MHKGKAVLVRRVRGKNAPYCPFVHTSGKIPIKARQTRSLRIIQALTKAKRYGRGKYGSPYFVAGIRNGDFKPHFNNIARQKPSVYAVNSHSVAQTASPLEIMRGDTELEKWLKLRQAEGTYGYHLKRKDKMRKND